MPYVKVNSWDFPQIRLQLDIMPKLKPETQQARKEHILDAAERAFAREGFHGCSMAEVCKEARISPGALYVHFSSKEDLIAGIAERDRAKIASQLGVLRDAPDLIEAIAALGEHYAVEEPRHKRVLCLEIGAESTRNETVGETFRSVDRFVLDSLEQLFARARDDGRIAPEQDPRTLALLIGILGDGIFWRRAVDPEFDSQAIMPPVMALVTALLNPRSTNEHEQSSKAPQEPAMEGRAS